MAATCDWQGLITVVRTPVIEVLRPKA